MANSTWTLMKLAISLCRQGLSNFKQTLQKKYFMMKITPKLLDLLQIYQKWGCFSFEMKTILPVFPALKNKYKSNKRKT